jgi:hypothetical protein
MAVRCLTPHFSWMGSFQAIYSIFEDLSNLTFNSRSKALYFVLLFKALSRFATTNISGSLMRGVGTYPFSYSVESLVDDTRFSVLSNSNITKNSKTNLSQKEITWQNSCFQVSSMKILVIKRCRNDLAQRHISQVCVSSSCTERRGDRGDVCCFRHDTHR